MKKRPRVFWIMAAVFFGVALSLPLQIVARFGFVDIGQVLARLSVLNGAVAVLCLGLGVSAWQASARLRWLGPVTVVAVALNNYWVGRSGLDLSPWLTNLGTLAFAGVFALCLHPDAQTVLRDQNRRWWRVEKRHELRVPVFVNGLSVAGLRLYAQSVNLSRSGILLSFSPHQSAADRAKLPVLGDVVGLSLSLSPLLNLQIQAKVVRRTRLSDADRAQSSEALGLLFIDLDALRWEQIRGWIDRPRASRSRGDLTV